jgi:hypothetical protein
MSQRMSHPRCVRLVIDGTGADYIRVSEAILDRKKTLTEGLTISGVTFCGDIRGLDADLLEKAESESDWKWRMYIDLLPRVQRTGGSGEPVEEVDSLTREFGIDLSVIREYRRVLHAFMWADGVETKF